MKKRFLFFSLLFLSLTACSLGAIGDQNARNTDDGSSEFACTDLFDFNGINAKTSTSAPFNSFYNDTRKGLLLSSAVSGSYATMKKALTGPVSFDMKASTADTVSPNLYHYSVRFDNTENGESFSFHVNDSGEKVSYYVEANGEKAGFYGTQETFFAERGYTKAYNRAGRYTEISYDLKAESSKFTFDPSAMSLTVSYDDRTVTVWNFLDSYVDGRAQFASLSPMDRFTVTFCFDEIRMGSKGEMVLYSVGSYDFSEPLMSDETASINADFSVRAVVGNEYSLPEPTNAGTDGLKVKIYHDGSILADASYDNVRDFTPSEEGSYYVIYYTDSNSGWFKLDAVSAASNNFVFDTSFNTDSVGFMATYHVPSCHIESNLLEEDGETTVSIYRDGSLLSDYENVDTDFDFVFSEQPGTTGVSTYRFVYSLKGGNPNFTETKTYEKKLNALNETISMEEYDEAYPLNGTLTVHPALVYRNGLEFDATAVVAYPSGKKTSDSTIVLDEPGFYTVSYQYAKGSFSRTFAAVSDVDSVFSTSKATGGYALANSNDKVSGYLAKMSNNGVLTATREIDLSQSTKNDCLVGLSAQPLEPGESELTTILITLTDADDPSNYLTIRLRQGEDNMTTGTYIRAAGNNQNYTGWYWNPWGNYAPTIENARAHEMGGFVHLHDFTGSMTYYNSVAKNNLCLYYDAAENALYSDWDNHVNSLYPSEHPTQSVSRTLVADFDDSSCFPTAWNGFESGKVILSITAKGVTDSADILITDLYGMDLSSRYLVDDDAPVISVDQRGFDGYPQGVVNEKFDILDVSATDRSSGVASLTTRVYGPDKSEQTILTDNVSGKQYFIPAAVGNYTIEYTAVDNFDNLTKKRVTIEIISADSYVPLTIEVGSHSGSCYLGNKIDFADVTVSGGVGYTELTRTATLGSQTISGESGSFIAENVGTYTLTYSATDHGGHTAEASYKVSVTRSAVPLFDEKNISLPKAFINGVTEKFPSYQAEYFVSDSYDSRVLLDGRITVTDASGEHVIGSDGLYTPSYDETVPSASLKLEFVYGSRTLTYGPYDVSVVASDHGAKFLANYFIKENATVDTFQMFSEFVAESPSSDAKITFIRSIPVEALNTEIGAPYDDDETGIRNNFSSLVVAFTDSVDSTISIETEIRMLNGHAYARLSGNDSYTMIGGSIDSTVSASTNTKIAFDSSTNCVYDTNGSLIGKAEKTANGASFDGFPSGKVYVSFAMKGVSGPSAIRLAYIGGQFINSNQADKTAPVLNVDGNYYGSFLVGDRIVLPKATSYDILSYCLTPTVTLRKLDGTYAKDSNGVILNHASADEERIFIPDDYGTYEVTYSATDTAGNETTITKNIVIKDNVPPTLTLGYTIPDSVKKGSSLNVLNYTVSDNIDSADDIRVNVSVVDPDGLSSSLQYVRSDGTLWVSDALKKGSYTFSSSGIYYLYYLVMDSSDNAAVFSYKVTVR